jgi:hypothetical protein
MRFNKLPKRFDGMDVEKMPVKLVYMAKNMFGYCPMMMVAKYSSLEEMETYLGSSFMSKLGNPMYDEVDGKAALRFETADVLEHMF